NRLDFRRLVEAIQRRGRRVTVVSTVRSQPSMVADELRRQADRFIDLVDLQAEIERALPADHPRARGREDLNNPIDDYEDDEEYYEPEPA
ncbi:MAG: NYN domain-containing protein, partial [Rhodospirillales bacterium]|nr:NYN domain-containing protein [Rhodospirillales bacterium]